MNEFDGKLSEILGRKVKRKYCGQEKVIIEYGKVSESSHLESGPNNVIKIFRNMSDNPG